MATVNLTRHLALGLPVVNNGLQYISVNKYSCIYVVFFLNVIMEYIIFFKLKFKFGALTGFRLLLGFGFPCLDLIALEEPHHF